MGSHQDSDEQDEDQGFVAPAWTHFGSSAYNYPRNFAACVRVHRGEMATLLGYGGQLCRMAVISLN